MRPALNLCSLVLREGEAFGNLLNAQFTLPIMAEGIRRDRAKALPLHHPL